MEEIRIGSDEKVNVRTIAKRQQSKNQFVHQIINKVEAKVIVCFSKIDGERPWFCPFSSIKLISRIFETRYVGGRK